ncbi:MAG: 1-deoxy-D-xylulose-5-phosphate synthase N-terminal domain-containing protein [bacterium]|nr:1-deoxy-D-xylulose-5-phosphate synthase N-terminal domain-containing protein [bacterium]
MNSIKANLSKIFGRHTKSRSAASLGFDDKIIRELNLLANEVRLKTLETIYHAGSGHIGTSLSMVDVITALLFHRLNWSKFLSVVKGKPADEQWAQWQNPELPRDRFVLSKGHGVPSWYAACAVGGYIKLDELKELRVMNSRLQGHPERRRFPFIDGTTGSLGQGQSVALGYALAKKSQGSKEKVYCIIGDGESNEGQVWETAMSAPKFDLDNLVFIIDFNKKQSEGLNEDIMNVEQLHYRWKVFHWHIQRINGHDMRALLNAFEEIDQTPGKPHVIIADTSKGYLGQGKIFGTGGHSDAVNKESYESTVKLLAEIKNSYGSH